MPIISVSPAKLAVKTYKERAKALAAVISDTMRTAGEKGINEAKIGGTYKDQSGNLRSSLGYSLTHNGEVQTMAVVEKTAGPKGDGEKGHEKVLSYLQTAGTDADHKGYELKVVAAMNYAVYVEWRKRVVLSAFKLKSREYITQHFKDLGFTVKE